MILAPLRLAILLTVPLAAVAQHVPDPGLQPRASAPAEDRPVVVVRNHAKSVLPDGASGLYRFDVPGSGRASNFGEGVQINEQFGDVTGYLTTKGPAEHGRPVPVSYFLNHIEGGGGALSFTTKAVHGVWYSFEGSVVRGPGSTHIEDGIYLLDGALITHDDAHHTTQQRSISLKQTAVH